MVLILSDNNDVSTNEIIDWLLYFDIDFCRINDTDKVEIEFIEISNDKAIINLIINNDTVIDFNQIRSYWYRRGFINYGLQQDKYSIFDNELFNETLKQFHLDETVSIIQFLHLYLKHIKHINGFFDNRINKIYSLFVAKNIGITIPSTKIISELEALNKENKYINKAIKQGFSFNTKKEAYLGYTARVESDFINRELSHFFPTLFQKEIQKQFEVRSFYLCGSFYSMAIFSQLNSNTEVDFRKYDLVTPNRTVPFNLPESIEKQLIELMKQLDLNSGSIDLIVDKDDNFVFLEVNPIGQFRQVSKPCNYNIEKKIAEYLI